MTSHWLSLILNIYFWQQSISRRFPLSGWPDARNQGEVAYGKWRGKSKDRLWHRQAWVAMDRDVMNWKEGWMKRQSVYEKEIMSLSCEVSGVMLVEISRTEHVAKDKNVWSCWLAPVYRTKREDEVFLFSKSWNERQVEVRQQHSTDILTPRSFHKTCPRKASRVQSLF